MDFSVLQMAISQESTLCDPMAVLSAHLSSIPDSRYWEPIGVLKSYPYIHANCPTVFPTRKCQVFGSQNTYTGHGHDGLASLPLSTLHRAQSTVATRCGRIPVLLSIKQHGNPRWTLNITPCKKVIIFSWKVPNVVQLQTVQGIFSKCSKQTLSTIICSIFVVLTRCRFTHVVSTVIAAPEGQRFIPSPTPHVSLAPMHRISEMDGKPIWTRLRFIVIYKVVWVYIHL